MAGPHYVTERLLKEFRGDDRSLRELAKSTGIVSIRATAKAGAEVGIWPDEIEKLHLQNLDNDAHRMLSRLVSTSGSAKLLGQEKEALKKWMFAFVIRSTAHRQICQQINQIYDETGATKALALKDIIDNKELYLEEARNGAPEKYGELVEMEGSAERADDRLLAGLVKRLLNDEIPRDENGLFHHMLRSGNYLEQMKSINGMRWTWLRSNVDFIIGDNPFCRTKRGTNRLNYGFNHKDLEVAFPVSRRLCLWMHRQPKEPNELEIRDGRVFELNRRQIESALSFVWGASEEALNPPPRKP